MEGMTVNTERKEKKQKSKKKQKENAGPHANRWQQ